MSTSHHGHEHDVNEGDTPHPPAHDSAALSPSAKRLMAVQELLVERGIIGDDDVQSRVDAMNARSPADGAAVVARAWVDPAYKRRLMADPKAAVAELGYAINTGLDVLENTEGVHHMVVCTLCSCYPMSLLGPPPDWYKSFAYRSRAVVEPRNLLSEFGLEIDDSVEVRVSDSTADLRYLVLPRRPPGTEEMSEEQLAELVTRDSMIGVANPRSPQDVANE